MNNDKLLARRLFHRLERGYYQGEYVVLNDGYFFAQIWATSDQEAIERFLAGQYGEDFE
jgi:hypothetical protein